MGLELAAVFTRTELRNLLKRFGKMGQVVESRCRCNLC